MSIYANILTGVSNNHETTSENANQLATDFVSEGVVGAITNTSGVAPATGAFAVNAQGTPNMTVAVSAGVGYVTATPSGQASQTLRIYNNASSNVTIAANSSGSTKYDWIYISVSAANAANPNSAGDNVATLVASRSSSASTDDGTPPTYGYPLAVVTVTNGASSITNGNIADKRERTGATATNTSLTTDAITLGYAQRTSAFTWATTAVTDVTDLSVTVTVPSGDRRIKITGYSRVIGSTATGANTVFFSIQEGATVLADTVPVQTAANLGVFASPIASFVPTAGSHTYKLTARVNAAGTHTVDASATSPAFILVELI